MKFDNGLEFAGKDGDALDAAIAKAGGRFGILFAGKVGSGKTTAAKAVAANGSGWRLVDCTKENEVGWLATWREWLGDREDLILDDLGRDADASKWGVRRKPVADFIREFHTAREGRTGRLFITTNGTFAELVERYDESVMSRVRELCVICKFEESRRAAAGAGIRAAASNPADAYRWNEYEAHGIDTGSDEFLAALWGAALPSWQMDALRILSVDFNAVSPEECEKARALLYWTRAATVGRYLRDAFVYGLCADGREREAFFDGFRRYVAAAFDGAADAQAHYNPQNAATFKDWRRPFDLGALLGDWRAAHKGRPLSWQAPVGAVRRMFGGVA